MLILRAHAGQVTGLPLSVEASCGQEWLFRFLGLELILADQLEDLLPQKRHLVVKNGNFNFLLLELILTDEVAVQLAYLLPW